MYNKFVSYQGNVYRRAFNIFTAKDCFVTQFKEKTDDTFYEYLDHLDSYAKDMKNNDVYDYYDIDFYVVYHDQSKTIETASQKIKEKEEAGQSVRGFERFCLIDHMWQVNEEGPYRLPTDIANDEVAIAYNTPSYSEDWVPLEDEAGGFAREGWCSKIVNIHDCEKLVVKYTYRAIAGKWLRSFEEKTVEKVMSPEDFKAEMLKHRLVNI